MRARVQQERTLGIFLQPSIPGQWWHNPLRPFLNLSHNVSREKEKLESTRGYFQCTTSILIYWFIFKNRVRSSYIVLNFLLIQDNLIFPFLWSCCWIQTIPIWTFEMSAHRVFFFLSFKKKSFFRLTFLLVWILLLCMLSSTHMYRCQKEALHP